MRNPASLRGVLGQILQREAPLTFAVSVAYNSDFSALSKQPLRPEGLGAVCEEFLNFRGGPSWAALFLSLPMRRARHIFAKSLGYLRFSGWCLLQFASSTGSQDAWGRV